jgi:hypothetical protein
MTRADYVLRAAVGIALTALLLCVTRPSLGGERPHRGGKHPREIRATHKVPRAHRHRTAGRCKDRRGAWLKGCR